MSQGTRGHLGRAQARGNDPEEGDLPPSPTMSQVLMEVERNRRDSHELLGVIARNTAQQRNELVSLNDFIQLHPPVFSYSTEPLDADDWLRSCQNPLLGMCWDQRLTCIHPRIQIQNPNGRRNPPPPR